MKINFKKKNIRDLFLSHWFKWAINRDFSKISPESFKKLTTVTGIFLLVIFLNFFFEVYIPANPSSHETITYTVPKGWGDEEIAKDLEKLGIIRSDHFFRLYTVLSLRHSMLQAGKYNLSSKMSIHQIVKKMAQGDVIKNKLVILEGWTVKMIGNYLESKGICQKDYFISLTQKDYSDSFDFLNEKPKDVGLEGYLYPDTYEVDESENCERVLAMMLLNFSKKMTEEIRNEISKQNKTIFDIIRMASIIEKEVKNLDEKKIVAGILWKRLNVGMPLQVDATVNYITGKNDPAVLIKDTKIDSPYNTYKYNGLPKGPISNPGMDSILAAVYPKETKYWYYLSDGRTIFSETLEQHNIAKAKYLKNRY